MLGTFRRRRLLGRRSGTSATDGGTDTSQFSFGARDRRTAELSRAVRKSSSCADQLQSRSEHGRGPAEREAIEGREGADIEVYEQRPLEEHEQ